MHIVVDIGNTRIKTGEFTEGKLIRSQVFDSPEACRHYLRQLSWDAAIVATVSRDPKEVFEGLPGADSLLIFSHSTPVPLSTRYKTPHTLGLDRLAAACGAASVCAGENCLVIDAGTSITYEMVEAGRTYLGGAISPGLQMRARALNTFTAKLPLIELPPEAKLIGDDTRTCLESGILNGARAEIRDFIRMYHEKFSNLRIIICGGDASFFKSVSNLPVLVVPELVLLGLNAILNYNVQKNG